MTAARRNSRLRFVLVLSLLVNLFLVGLVIVRVGLGSMAGVSNPVRRELDAYPLAFKREFRHELFIRRDEVQSAVAELRASRERVRALIVADTIDETALRARFAEVREDLVVLVTMLQDTFLAASLRVPASTRRDIPNPESLPVLDLLEGHDEPK